MAEKPRRPIPTAEDRLLLLCCRPVFDTATAEAVSALIRASLNLSRVMDLAERERVIPLLSSRLGTAVPDLVPRHILHELKRRSIEALRLSLALGEELVQVMTQIEAGSIRALTFKGPALAFAAYGNLSARMFIDIDLFVDEPDFAACQRLLESHGYAVAADYGFEKAFHRPGSWGSVDLHRRLTPRAFPSRLRFDDLWARRQAMTLLGAEVQSLSPADNLLVLCLQMACDRYQNRATLAKFADVAALIHGNPDIDWDGLLAEAGRVGLTRRLGAVLGAVANLLALPLPATVTSLFEQSSLLRRLSHFIGDGVLGRSNKGPLGFIERVAFHGLVHEQPSDKLAQFLMIPWKLRNTWRR